MSAGLGVRQAVAVIQRVQPSARLIESAPTGAGSASSISHVEVTDNVGRTIHLDPAKLTEYFNEEGPLEAALTALTTTGATTALPHDSY